MTKVVVRGARPEDLTAVVAVMNAVDVATLGEPDTTEEDIASGWAESGFDLAADAFVAENGEGSVVGYAELYDRGEGGIFDLDAYPHPDADTAVGAALLDVALERAAVRAGEGATLATWLQVDEPRVALFTSRGFEPVRQFVRMRHESSHAETAADAPEGIVVRTVDAQRDARALHAVLVAAFAQHARPLTPSFERFVQQHLEHPDFDPRFWFVAESNGRIVGAITAFDHGDIGFIRHVGVLDEVRGRGVGSALVRAAVRALADAGQARVDLGVDLDDDVGAAGLYERLGFRVQQHLELMERRL